MRSFWVVALLVFATSAKAATITSTGAGGDWSVGTTWVGNAVPLATDDVIIVNGAVVTLSTNQTCVNLTLNGTAQLDFSTNNRTLTVNGTMTMNGTSQVTGNANNRILSLQGDFNVPAGQSVSVGGIRISQVITGTFNLAGTFTPTDNTGQKTFGNANFYDGCLIDASVTEAITIAGNLAVLPATPGEHAKLGRVSVTVTGTTTVTGYLEFRNSASGAKTFNGTITVAAGGTWDNIIGEDPVINCSIVNDGVWPQPTGGNGRYDVNVAGTYTYSGTRTIAMTRLRIQTNATVTNLGSLQLSHNNNAALTVNGGGIFNNGDGVAGAILTLNGDTDLVSLGGGGSAVNFSNAGNTVIYSATVAQNVYPTTYHILTCSGNNTASVAGATVVNSALNISGTTTVDVTGGTDLTGAGNLVMTGTSLLRLSSAGTVPALTGASHSLAAGTTINFYRAGVQTAAASASYPYQNVLISGNGGSAVNLNAVSSIAGNLTVSNAGTFTNTLNTPPLITVLGAFSYGSTATTTLNTSLNTASVTLSSTGGFTYSNQTITLDKNDAFWAVTGTPVITAAGTAMVVFSGPGTNQQITGTTAPNFNRLRIDNANDVTLDITPVTVTGNLNLVTGRLITGTNTVVMQSGSSVSRTSGFVEGNLNKTFALGTTSQTYDVGTGTSYTPAVVTCTSVTTSGSLTVAAVDGDHPDIFSALIEPNNTVNRYWAVTNVSVVFSAFSTGQIQINFNWVNADEDAALDNTAIVKWYNNATLTWTGSDQLDEVAEQNPPMTVVTNIASNSSTISVMNPAQLPVGNVVDFQVGEKIDPTFVYNRLTGANNWNNLATWIQQRSGVITLTNGSPTITGASTNFQAELAVGNIIMLITTPGTTYTITSIDPVLQSMTVAPSPALSTSGGFGRQYIPGINAPTSDVDAVVIGNTNIADGATTITLDTDAQILTLTVGSTARNTAQVLVHQNSTRDLIVLANATVSQPGAAVTNEWSINAGTADVQGDVTIGTAANNTVTRVSRINLTTGTLGAGSLRFRTATGAGREAQAVMNITGAATVNLHGALNFLNARATLISAAGSTFNFDRTASGQSIAVPASSTATWAYANIHGNNTSAGGVTFNFTSSAASVTGNVRVQTGLMILPNFNMVGAAGSTFEVTNGATFEMRSTLGGATGSFPSGFGTTTLGPTSTVIYNQTGNTNPWSVVTTTYGHLIIGQNGSTRNFEIANATTNVAGDLTIGDGASTPTFRGTGAATLNVTGNLLINASAVLNATNITNLNLGGNWTDNGSFTESTNTVTFNSPAANVLQTLGGTVTETFYNLVLNTSAGTDAVRLTNSITVSNVLTLTQGGLELNGNTLSVANSSTAAIVRTSGYVKSENISAPYGTLRWFIDNSVGAHVYPFGVSSTQYIPFTMNVTVAGVKGGLGTGYVPVSTYATAATNPPGEFPSGVTNLNGTTGGASVTDRYWNITLGSAEYVTTRPTSTLTFTALNTEKPTTWTAIGEPPTNPNQLLTQRWNTAAYWDPAQTSPAQTYTNDAPAAGTFQVGVPSVTSYSTSWTITDSSVPLPIELVSFTAFARDGVVELNWTTQSERDNDHFTVQRTANAELFEDVIRVKGHGTSASVHEYATVDNDPQPGRWYYRLRQTDFDGTASFSRLVAVDVPVVAAQDVYPNPGEGNELNVRVPSGSNGKLAQVWIVSSQGMQVFQSAPFTVQDRTIRVALPVTLASGVYVVSVVVENNLSRFKWVVR